jgi:uncharacterized protein (TIGR03118 family)
MKNRLLTKGGGYAALLALVTLPALAHAGDGVEADAATFYTVKYLTSDGMSTPNTDPNLVNGWGIAAGPSTPWWVANNGTSTSTLYRANGKALSLVVSIPGVPTGIVYNGGPNFVLTKGRRSKPALFMFASMTGTISAWNTLDQMNAIVKVDHSMDGAVYTGLAIASTTGGDFLYAADFQNGRVDVVDGTFNTLMLGAGAFVDPTLPMGYAPFGIQNIGGKIYVSFALRDDATGAEVHGPGLGYVSAFDTAGVFLERVASGGDLNAPWGMTMAPADIFGPASGHLLVGNFGDGRINAFESAAPHTAKGPLKDKAGMPIVVNGVWGIAFGTGSFLAGPTKVLYFAAGPDSETHGAFGSIKLGRSLY